MWGSGVGSMANSCAFDTKNRRMASRQQEGSGGIVDTVKEVSKTMSKEFEVRKVAYNWTVRWPSQLDVFSEPPGTGSLGRFVALDNGVVVVQLTFFDEAVVIESRRGWYVIINADNQVVTIKKKIV